MHIAAKCTWRVLDDTWGSDHYPILFKYDRSCYTTPINQTPRWSMKKADWDKFENACEKFITEPNKSDDIEEIYNTFTKQLISAIDYAIPKTNPPKTNKSTTSWWNEECKKAIFNKKKALKTLQKSSLPADLIAYKRANAIARQTIKTAKKKEWEKFCNEINYHTPSKVIWNQIKRINKIQSNRSIPILKNNDTDIITDKQKANYLTDSFANISSDTNHNSEFFKIKNETEEEISINNNNDNVINEPFTIIELNKAIDMSKCTTPGKDEISNNIIKHFSIKTRDYLLTISLI